MIYYAAIVISSATFEGYEIRTRYQMGNHIGTIQPFLLWLKTTVGCDLDYGVTRRRVNERRQKMVFPQV